MNRLEFDIACDIQAITYLEHGPLRRYLTSILVNHNPDINGEFMMMERMAECNPNTKATTLTMEKTTPFRYFSKHAQEIIDRLRRLEYTQDRRGQIDQRREQESEGMTITVTDWKAAQSPWDRGLKIQVNINADTDEEGEMLRAFFKTITDTNELANNLVKARAECMKILYGIDSALSIYDRMTERAKE